MTVFLDASALVAIIRDEPEAADLEAVMRADPKRLISGMALWEAARALGRASDDDAEMGLFEAERYCSALGIAVITIGAAEATAAIRAHAAFGKGRHRAQLNMGDCFAYACAKTNNARLLYKGDDFIHTDLA